MCKSDKGERNSLFFCFILIFTYIVQVFSNIFLSNNFLCNIIVLSTLYSHITYGYSILVLITKLGPSMLMVTSLLWRHVGCDGVSYHQPHDCLPSPLFRRISKETSKLRVTGLCAGISPVTGEFPAQMASNADFFQFDDVIMSCRNSFQTRLWNSEFKFYFCFIVIVLIQPDTKFVHARAALFLWHVQICDVIKSWFTIW